MLIRILKPHAESVYALLRIVTGLLFAFHGVQGLTGFLSPMQASFGTQLWLGGVIELVTGLALAAGVLTVPAAFLASGTMAVAYVQFHWRFALGASFLPAVNQGEAALINAFLFLFIACRGAGRWSLDARLAPRAPAAAPVAA
jgi:putative oxidoreductase